MSPAPTSAQTDQFLDDPLQRVAAQSPDATAIITAGKAWTFHEFNERVASVAGALASLGVKPGDRVSILADNHPDYLALHLAAAQTGAILHVLNVRLTAAEMAYAVNDAGSTLLFVDEGYSRTDGPLKELLSRCDKLKSLIGLAGTVELAQRHLAEITDAGHPPPLPPRQPSDPLVLIYTSGTTGRPKGALQNHSGSLAADRIMAKATAIGPSDAWLASMPYFHQAGLIRSRITLAAGGRNVILGRLDPDAVARAVFDHQITIAMLVGGQLTQVIERASEQPNAGSPLRMLLTGSGMGARTTARIIKACQLLGCDFMGGYGQTETHGTITVSPSAKARENPDTCGFPGESVKLAIWNDEKEIQPPGIDGEIMVRGITTGRYWNNESANAALYTDGWLHTGDLGHLDQQGWLYFSGRKKELVKTGAENVYPREVEVVLEDHPNIVEVAIIGLPDQQWGEAVTAIVVAGSDPAPTLEELRNYCRGKIAGYKLPQRLHLVDKLPRNHTGKAQTGLLRERFGKSAVGREN